MTDMTWHQQRAAGMHAMPYDIVAYDYNAARYCPDCILTVIVGTTLRVTSDPEMTLNAMAAHSGIDRSDESTFDQSDFPKTTIRSQVESGERCECCGQELG